MPQKTRGQNHKRDNPSRRRFELWSSRKHVHAQIGIVRRNRGSQGTLEDGVDIGQNPESMKQVDLVGHDPKLDSQKSTNLQRTCRTGIAQSCAIQFERATVEQMDNKCLAIVK